MTRGAEPEVGPPRRKSTSDRPHRPGGSVCGGGLMPAAERGVGGQVTILTAASWLGRIPGGARVAEFEGLAGCRRGPVWSVTSADG